uniref:Uncharacterized protein n=1 Tax=Anguilla anguilla TaxID=7936 RepID=A0A0E9UCU8_ANGAN
MFSYKQRFSTSCCALISSVCC